VTGVTVSSSPSFSSLRLDTGGNLIAAGYRNNGRDNDFLVVKFSPSGQELWRASEGENTQLATALAADAPGPGGMVLDGTGNAYITGRGGLANANDFITAKIGATGNEIWRAALAGAAGTVARGYVAAVDASGNVYAGGDSTVGGLADFMIVKYDTGGAEQWRRQPGHAAGRYNSLRDMKLDSAGNIFATGFSSAGSDFMTIKYSSAGTELWRDTYTVTSNSNDTPVAMAVDSSGNVIVTGTSIDGANYGYLTLKYAASGTLLWGNTLPGDGNTPQQPYAVATDAAGNVIVAGDTLIKYGPGGNVLWQMRPGFRAYAIAVTANGDIIAGGSSSVVARFAAADGNFLWQASSLLDANSAIYAVALDADGNAYVTARNDGDTNGDYVTVKYGLAGDERWRITSTTGGGGLHSAVSLRIDSGQNVFVAGNAVMVRNRPPSLLPSIRRRRPHRQR